MRLMMRCGIGALAGAAAWLVLAVVVPAIGEALGNAFDGCTDRHDCVGDSIGSALLAVSVVITLWWLATFLAGWLVLRLLRVERALGTAALGMVFTMLSWVLFGELIPATCVPGFALAALATGLPRTSS